MLKMDDKVLPFRFNAANTFQSTENTLYILFGQGLGDLIYGNRVLHLLCRKLKGWKIFVFLSKEWEDLSILSEENVTVIWYPSIQEFGDRFKWGYEYIKKNGKKNGTEYFIHWDSQSLPDRYARHETVFESTCREINISLIDKDLRGYIPDSKTEKQIVYDFLKSYNLQEKKFYVLGPHTGDHKNWGIENYEALGKKLYQEFKYKCVIVGVSNAKVPQIAESIPLLSCSLDMIANVISHSAFFVGNDSGITHLAACLDIPVYEVFAKARLEPLIEWRTLGPFVRHVIEPNLDDANSILPETLFHIIKRDLSSFEKNKTLRFEVCPACKKKMSYIVFCDEQIVTSMCGCGGILTLSENSENKEIDDPLNSLNVSNVFMPSNLGIIQHFKKFLSSDKIQEFEVCISLVNPFKPINCIKTDEKSHSKFFWSLDSLLLFFKDLGLMPVKIKKDESHKFYRINFSKNRKGFFLFFPWGGGNGLCMNSDLYFRYFCWMPFANYYRASKIPKNILDCDKDKRISILASIFIFTSFLGIKSAVLLMKNLIRLFVKV